MTLNYPHFLGIGVHKAGTSWLYWQMSQRPDVWLPPAKEVHFFDRSSKYPSPSHLATAAPLKRLLDGPKQRAHLREGYWRLRRDIAQRDWSAARSTWHWYFGHYNESWYRRLFSRHIDSHVCGEITPAYSMLDSDDIARIHALNPDMKFILMLRNPIDRAWSALRFNRDRGFSDLDLTAEEDVISRLQSPDYLLRGDYLRTLENYLAYFPAEQILVGFYDAIRADPTGLFNGVCEFLELPVDEQAKIDNSTRVNPSQWQAMPERIKAYLEETYTPAIHALADRVGSYANHWLPDSKPAAGGSRDPGKLPAVVRLG